MSEPYGVPNPYNYLPDLMAFVERLYADTQAGKLASHAAFKQAVFDFHTPDRLQTVDAVLGRWQHMASFANGVTLWHVHYVLVSLLGLKNETIHMASAAPHGRVKCCRILDLRSQKITPLPFMVGST